MAKSQQERSAGLPKAETGWTVDPLSDLVSAQELSAWRRDVTTGKVLRYLARFRAQLVEHIADGDTTGRTAEETAQLTAEAVGKAVLLKEILSLEAKDIAQFYGHDEPQDQPKGATH